jgi:hypothetical protein
MLGVQKEVWQNWRPGEKIDVPVAKQALHSELTGKHGCEFPPPAPPPPLPTRAVNCWNLTTPAPSKF